MDPRLVELLERAIASRETGSLFVGQGRRTRQVYLSGTDVLLVDAGRERRFCPLPFLLDGSVVPISELDIVFSRFGSEPRSLERVLSEDYSLEADEAKSLRRNEVLEELLEVLRSARDHFVFEAGTVPEEALVPGARNLTPIPNTRFIEGVRRRVEERARIEAVLPHPEELPVLTVEGSARRGDPGEWLFQRVSDLVDGFRDLDRIRRDSLFSPHLTEMVLTSAILRGWIRKKRFPEFQNLHPERMGAEQLAVLARRIEGSIPTAVDEVPLRRTLGGVLERLGDAGPIIANAVALGDQLVARKELQAGLEAYRIAAERAPADPKAGPRLTRLLEQFADEALARGAPEEARRHLEEALPHRLHDESIPLRIVQSHGADEGGAARAATQLAGRMHRAGESERARRFLQLALESYPRSDALRRTSINFLLDHGLTEEAVRELQSLAAELDARGHAEEARQVLQKIEKIGKADRSGLRTGGPASGVSPDRSAHRPPAGSPRRGGTAQGRAGCRSGAGKGRVGVAIAIALLAVGLYQGWLWRSADRLTLQAEALERGGVPTVDSTAHARLRQEWRALLGEAGRLQTEHPLPYGTWQLTEARVRWGARLATLEAAFQSHLEGLRSRARTAELRGSRGEATRLHEEILRLAEPGEWREQAQAALAALEVSDLAARELREQGRLALDRGERAEAFRHLRELLDRFPASAESAEVLLPVTVVSTLPGARIFVDGIERGTAPLELELPPYRETLLRAELDGATIGELRLSDIRGETLRIAGPEERAGD